MTQKSPLSVRIAAVTAAVYLLAATSAYAATPTLTSESVGVANKRNRRPERVRNVLLQRRQRFGNAGDLDRQHKYERFVFDDDKCVFVCDYRRRFDVCNRERAAVDHADVAVPDHFQRRAHAQPN